LALSEITLNIFHKNIIKLINIININMGCWESREELAQKEKGKFQGQFYKTVDDSDC
jgi:hypothetical protein